MAISVEAPVEDAEHLVVLEVEGVDVAGDLGVGGVMAEAQVAGALVERHQVGEDALAVARPERADRHPRPAGGRLGRRGVGRPDAPGRSGSGLRGGGHGLGDGLCGPALDREPAFVEVHVIPKG